MRNLQLELRNLQKLQSFLADEAAEPAPDADPQAVRRLQLDLENLQKLEACLAKHATASMLKNDDRRFALRLFMSKFEYGP